MNAVPGCEDGLVNAMLGCEGGHVKSSLGIVKMDVNEVLNCGGGFMNAMLGFETGWVKTVVGSERGFHCILHQDTVNYIFHSCCESLLTSAIPFSFYLL